MFAGFTFAMVGVASMIEPNTNHPALYDPLVAQGIVDYTQFGGCSADGLQATAYSVMETITGAPGNLYSAGSSVFSTGKDVIVDADDDLYESELPIVGDLHFTDTFKLKEAGAPDCNDATMCSLDAHSEEVMMAAYNQSREAKGQKAQEFEIVDYSKAMGDDCNDASICTPDASKEALMMRLFNEERKLEGRAPVEITKPLASFYYKRASEMRAELRAKEAGAKKAVV